MLFELRSAEPGLTEVQTWNAAINEPLIKVNQELGFVADRQWLEYEGDVVELAAEPRHKLIRCHAYDFRCRACGDTFEVEPADGGRGRARRLPGRPRRHREAADHGRPRRPRRRDPRAVRRRRWRLLRRRLLQLTRP